MSEENQEDTFKESYETLQKVSDQIKNQQDPNIDELVPLVDKGLAAYEKCKKRIEAVKAVLSERLPQDAV